MNLKRTFISQRYAKTQGGDALRPAPCAVVEKCMRAFTLIELLVVIAIIGLLLSIVTPSLRKARDTAQRLVCFSNMRQMGTALFAYRFEHDDRLPPSSCHLSDPDTYWLNVLTRYTQEGLLFQCPSDRGGPFADWHRPLDQQPDDVRWSSFALNALLDPAGPLGGKYNKVADIRRPAYTIYISEAPDSWKGVDHTHPESWGSLTEAKTQIAWDRHRALSNYLFAEGHAETLAVEDTLDWPARNLWWPQFAPTWPPPEFY